MLVLFGPMANISVVKLYSAAIVPGLLLAACYLIYVIVYVRVKKNAIVETGYEDNSVHYTVFDGIKAFVPFLFVIFMVLGLILLGVCSPTEAAAAGSFGAIILAIAYRKMSLKVLVNAALSALKTSAMVMCMTVGANIFTSVFFGVGGSTVMTNFVLSLNIGPVGTFIAVMALVFVLGMLIDWVGILLIYDPIFMPNFNMLGYDKQWASMMIIVLLQTSFLTPPFAYALFYLKGVSPPGVTTPEIYKGIIPFILIILGVLLAMVAFPGIATWLPNALA